MQSRTLNNNYNSSTTNTIQESTRQFSESNFDTFEKKPVFNCIFHLKNFFSSIFALIYSLLSKEHMTIKFILCGRSEIFNFLIFFHFIMTERKVHETQIVTTDKVVGPTFQLMNNNCLGFQTFSIWKILISCQRLELLCHFSVS